MYENKDIITHKQWSCKQLLIMLPFKFRLKTLHCINSRCMTERLQLQPVHYFINSFEQAISTCIVLLRASKHFLMIWLPCRDLKQVFRLQFHSQLSNRVCHSLVGLNNSKLPPNFQSMSISWLTISVLARTPFDMFTWFASHWEEKLQTQTSSVTIL